MIEDDSFGSVSTIVNPVNIRLRTPSIGLGPIWRVSYLSGMFLASGRGKRGRGAERN